MKQFIALLAASALSVCVLYGQSVGIGTTTPNASALLDLESGNKGILIPRVSLSNTLSNSPVSSPATGLLVWNTNANTTNGSGTGFYFWNGSRWQKLSTGSEGWQLTGNTADTALHFIGTTNNAGLMFRTFSQHAGGIFPQGENITLGFGAGPLLRYNSQNFTGERNTFLGTDAGHNETNGRFNTFIGARSGFGSNGSFGNTMVGVQAGANLTTGTNNVGIGIGASSVSTGSRNIGIGSSAGGFLTGSENVAIGYDVASFVAGGNNNVLIGSRAATGNFGLFPKFNSYDNVVIGDSAMHKMNGASNNVMIGKRSGLNSAVANFNVFVGDSTGLNNFSGSRNTFIGSKARANSSGRNNATAIGAHAEAGADNVVVIGGIAGINGAATSVNVGIGTTAPNRKLHVVNGSSTGINSSSSSTLVLDRSGGPNYLSMLIDNNQEGALIFGKVGSNQPPFDGGIFYNTSGAGAMQFRNKGGLTRMIIHDDGRLSVGSNSNIAGKMLVALGSSLSGINPYQRSTLVLDGGNADHYLSMLSTDKNQGIIFGSNQSITDASILYLPASRSLSFQTANAGISRMRIDGEGRIGMGTDNPEYRLHVVTADAQNFGYREGIVVENIADGIGSNGLANTGEAAISFKNAGANGTGTRKWFVGLNQTRNLSIAYGDDFAGGSVTKVFIDSTGNMGIGTTSPSEKLHVNGSILATGTISPSDIRFKKNIMPLPAILSQVMALQPMRYEWKKEDFPDYAFDDKKTLGVMAQQLEQQFPELVVTGSNGFKAVDYSKLSVVLLKAIQEQQATIAQQQEALAALALRLRALEENHNN